MAERPLDEKVWSDYGLAQQMGGIHTNTVLMYFSKSPFFDPTSNNAIVERQSMLNPDLLWQIGTRDKFEETLASMQGVEFIVSHDPSRAGTFHNHNGVWVIRKQRRRKPIGSSVDEVTPLSSYFVVGMNVYMAPSVGNVLGNRMLSCSYGLTQSLKSVADLTHRSTQPILESARGNLQKERQAGISHPKVPLPSKLDGLDADKAQNEGVDSFQQPTLVDELDSDLLAESLLLSLRYRDEYMDENPLVGEPGSFVMRKSRTDNTLVKPSQVSKSATPLPPPIETNIENPMTKGSKENAKTPITPGGSKRRKKSKVLSTATAK